MMKLKNPWLESPMAYRDKIDVANYQAHRHRQCTCFNLEQVYYIVQIAILLFLQLYKTFNKKLAGKSILYA